MNLERNTDAELVIKVELGRLMRWLEYKLGDRHAAEDIAQNVCMKTWMRLSQEKVDNPAGLIFKIANDLTKNEYKRRERQRTVFEPAADLLYFGDDATRSDALDPEATLATKQQVQNILSAISTFPKVQRRIFIMNRFRGKTYAEIADELNVSVSKVEKEMMKSLKMLRAIRNGK